MSSSSSAPPHPITAPTRLPTTLCAGAVPKRAANSNKFNKLSGGDEPMIWVTSEVTTK